MKTISLGRGFIAIVDDEDYERINRFNWTVDVQKKQVYARRNEARDGKIHTIRMHQDVLGKAPSGYLIDHKNTNGLDNRKSNLRICKQHQNLSHTGKVSSLTSSKFKGVCRRPFSWSAQIAHQKKLYYLGHFKTEEMAARAYDQAAVRLHQEFAFTNEMLGLFK